MGRGGIMRKLIFVFQLLFIVPVNVFASDISLFEYNESRIYDLADIYNEKEEIKLTNSIDTFIKLSGLDLIFVTVDTEEEVNRIWYSIYENDFFGKGLHKNGIVITYNNSYYSISNFGDGFRNYMTLNKFKITYLDKYDDYVANANYVSNIIDEWIKYYAFRDIGIITFIICLSVIFTLVILKIVKRRYNILHVYDAENYYNENEIEILK